MKNLNSKPQKSTPNFKLLLVTLILVVSSNFVFSQAPGDPSNFSIWGDIFSGTPTSETDDWFQGATGFGIIDESNFIEFTDITTSLANTPFFTGQNFLQYDEVNGYLLYDAIYARDYINYESSNNDLTAFKQGKNGENPGVDWTSEDNVIIGSSVDLVDVYAHLRREGVTVGENLWLNMAVSTLDNDGSHFIDFELFAEPIEFNGGSFINSGTAEGHTAWEFDELGNVIASGDLVAGFEFNNESVSGVELRIWVLKADYGTDGTDGLVDPVGFTWGPVIDGSGIGSLYGYAQIVIPPGGSFSTGITNEDGVPGPPWRTFVSAPGLPIASSEYVQGSYAEVGINLSALGIDPSLKTGNACDAPFTKLLVKSRTSASFTADLKDFSGPYDFLGAPAIDTSINSYPSYFTCANTLLTLAPLNPYDLNHYYRWISVEDLGMYVEDEAGVTQAVFTTNVADYVDVTVGDYDDFIDNPIPVYEVYGETAKIMLPGIYYLEAAPITGCTTSISAIKVLAQPCAVDDNLGEIVENTSITYNVLGNDSDLGDTIDPTLITLTLPPSNGVVDIDPVTGEITYTPTPDWYGIETFEYQICDTSTDIDGNATPLCDIATVIVSVLEDVDDDGVANIYDLDNDNDGIPDTIELQCNSVPNPNLIIDGDFENINIMTTIIAGVTPNPPGILDESDQDVVTIYYPGIWKGLATYIPGWESLDTYNYFEIWQNPEAVGPIYENTDKYGAYSGIQFVEVEASSSFGYYQDVTTTPGDVLRWSFAHRKREINVATDPVDIIAVVIGEGGDPHSLTTADIQSTYSTAPNYAWSEHYGFYTVPEGQTTTRIWFTAQSTYGGKGRNFIDKIELNVFDKCYDADADGIPNYLDLDSDNDGIPDVLEAGLTDANNDGLVDTTSYGVNGLADNVETSDDKFADINYTIPNTDAASDSNPDFTLYNFLDVDSDNDGITDTTEAFQKNDTYNDADNGGEIDLFVDTDDNGWHDPIDAEGAFPEILNSDADTIPNYLDLDSDGDGLPDTYEANFQVPDGENDGIVGTGIPSDTDGDGLADSNDPDAVALFDEDGDGEHDNLNGNFNADRDNDGVKNYLDIDADNDGIIDNIEGQPTFDHRLPTGIDADLDGIDDAYDVDIDTTYGIGYTNTDGGSAPDYVDTDSENDKIYDILESITPSAALDQVDNFDSSVGGDGMVDVGLFEDADGDGLHDGFDNVLAGTTDSTNATNGGQTAFTHPDTSHQLPDLSYVDDGDRDWRERSDQDNDNDGIPDASDLDDDNDGILDTVEDLNTDGDGDPRTNPTDTDGDGIPNYFDLDSDGDGLTDTYEAGGTFDADSSGMPGTDMLLYNSDPTISQVGITPSFDYGVPDQYTILYGSYPQDGIIPKDTDGDTIPDYLDLDSDNDGISDVLEAGGIDGNGDGIYGDGAENNDFDSDGLNDDLDNLFNSKCFILSNTGTHVDTDGDGVWDVGETINYEFIITNIHNQDYFNVSLTDADLTTGPTSLTGLTELGGGSGNDLAIGATATATGSYTLKTTDISLGSLFNDAEVTFTVSGKVFNATYRETQSSGIISEIPSCETGTLDGEPLTTFVVADGYHQALDTDEDGIPNHLDLDSDNDTIPDNVEGQSTLGYIAPSGTDTDGSGIDDSYDIHNGTPIVPVDTDGDGTPDYLDLDSDGDDLYDIVEAHDPSTPNTFGMTNNLVGNNGLDNTFDDATAGDTYLDPNGSLDNTQTDNFIDADADVFSGGDVDYRDDTFNDNDLDGIADTIDLDDDNDGILDTVESNGVDPLLDSDGDGIPNYLDEDYCTLNDFGICTNLDLDNDGIPNFFDLDSDNDGCSDANEAYNFNTPNEADGGDDGVYGVGTPSVDSDGLVIAAGVTDSAYNTTPVVDVTNISGTYDFLDSAVYVACKADLSITKLVFDAGGTAITEILIGATIKYEITITNEGPYTTTNVQVQDTFATGLTDISGTVSVGTFDNTTGIWELGEDYELLIGDTNKQTLTITATVGPNCGPLYNSAEIINSDRLDPDSTPGNGN